MDKLHLVEEGYKKLASYISKTLKAITNSNHLLSITPKNYPNKFLYTDFPSLKSVTKAADKRHRIHVISISLQTRPLKKCNYSNEKQGISNGSRHNNYVQ